MAAETATLDEAMSRQQRLLDHAKCALRSFGPRSPCARKVSPLLFILSFIIPRSALHFCPPSPRSKRAFFVELLSLPALALAPSPALRPSLCPLISCAFIRYHFSKYNES